MSISVILDTSGMQAQIAALTRRAASAMQVAERRAFVRIKEKTVVRARENCPISPTKQQYEASMKKGWVGGRIRSALSVKAYTRIRYGKNGQILKGASKLKSKQTFNPGTLINSIEGESGTDYAKIFTNQDSADYAVYIHDRGPNGTGDWQNRGLGTVARGNQADDKFIERAIIKSECQDILRDEINRELAIT